MYTRFQRFCLFIAVASSLSGSHTATLYLICSGQQLLTDCPSTLSWSELGCGISDKFPTQFGAKFPAKLPNGHFGLQNKAFGKSVWKIRRHLRIPFPETQATLREPNLLCVELVRQWCGAFAHSTWLRCCESHTKWHLVSRVSPGRGPHNFLSHGNNCPSPQRTPSVVVCIGWGPTCLENLGALSTSKIRQKILLGVGQFTVCPFQSLLT